MSIKKQIDERTKDTRLNDFLHAALFKYRFWKYRIHDIVSGRYQGSPKSVEGFYEIDVEAESIPEFTYSLHVGKKHRRDRIMGRYEKPVMQRLTEEISTEDVFWEVGAWRGWYSLALSPVVKEVVAMEAREHPIERLNEARQRNGFKNIRTVNSMVNSLDDYIGQVADPDVILMDIEGWEYEVLQASTSVLESIKPTFIIEVHEDSGWIQGEVTNPRGIVEEVESPDKVDSEGIRKLLQEYGYEVSTINVRRDTHSHILATPPE